MNATPTGSSPAQSIHSVRCCSLLGVAIGLMLASTAGAEPRRHFIAIRNQAPQGRDTALELNRELARYGYTAAPRKRFEASVDELSLAAFAFNSLNNARSRGCDGCPTTLIAVVQTDLRVDDDGLLLRQRSGEWLVFEDFLDAAINRVNQTKSHLLLALDGAAPVDAQTLANAALQNYTAEELGRLTLVVQRSQAASTPLALTLQRALTSYRGDGPVTVAHVASHLGEEAREDIHVAGKRSNWPLGERHDAQSLEDLLNDFADQITQHLESNQVDTVLTPNLAVRGDAAGLAPYVHSRISERMQGNLPSRDWVNRETANQFLQANQLELPSHARHDSLPSLPAPYDHDVTALLRGELSADVASTETANLRLSGALAIFKAGEHVRDLQLPSLRTKLQGDEAAMSGKLNMSGNQALQQLQWSVVGLNEDPNRALGSATHPLLDPEFPIQVRLRVGGHWRKPTFDENGRRMRVPLRAQEEYTIEVENKSDKQLFLRLLVDGKNTLPEYIDDSMAPIPARYVNLTNARVWHLDGPGTYHFSGFVNNIANPDRYEKNADLNSFRVVDAGDLNVPPERRDQLGMITAAFYPAVPQSKSSMSGRSNIGTGAGRSIHQRVDLYRGDLGPRKTMLGQAPINIYYGLDAP